MKVFIETIFIFATLFAALVILVDRSNGLIEMQRDFPALQNEREKLRAEVAELEYLYLLQANEKELLKRLLEKPYSHLQFRSQEEMLLFKEGP